MTHIKSLAALAAIPFTLLLGAAAYAQPGPQPTLPKVTLGAGMHLIQAEVARTPDQQATGMMFRREMGRNEGMLFVNDEAGPRCFWMRNTLIPLAIAFIADDGTIVNTDEMKPQTDDSHCSARPVRYVLEMRKGWFKEHGVEAGVRLRGAPFGTPQGK